MLGYVLSGIKRAQASSGTVSQRPRLPITAGVMRVLRSAWKSQGITLKHQMLWVACCTCFHGFLRSGEATVQIQSANDPAVHLSVADLALLDSDRDPKAIVVRIKASKTDPFRRGVTLYLGRTGNELCPVAALLAYVSAPGMEPGPLFVFEDGTPLTRDALVRELRAALSRMGIDPTPYSGHSFRSIAASTAATAGVEDAIIKILGQWQSSAYQLYVNLPRESISSRLANQ